MLRRKQILLILSLAPLLAPGAASAQSLSGVVVENGTRRHLAGVQLLLLDADGRTRAETISDDSGGFHIQAPEPGRYVITGGLIGFATIRSDLLELGRGEELLVEIVMDVEAVPLAPLVVTGRNSDMNPQIAEFYDRLERGRRTGIGHFISREQIERAAPLESTDLLRTVPGVRVVQARGGRGAGLRMSGGCIPAIYVDGMQVNRPPLTGTSLDDMVSAFSIEGIEIYRGASAQQGSYYDPGGCGLVLVWTRRGSDSGAPWSWRRFFAATGLVAALYFLLQ